MAEKWILAPPGKRGKNGRKMGKWMFFTHFWADFPIFRPFFASFFPFSLEPKSIVLANFVPISGRRPEMGSVQGNRATRIATLVPGQRGRKVRVPNCFGAIMPDFL